jgi:tetratricopeptide (TPR) repeat protein
MRILVLVAVGLILAAPPAPAPTYPQAAPQIIALLDRYDAGEFNAVVDAFAGIDDVEDARKTLEKHGAAWTEALGPAAVPRRRLVAATFALEFANARMTDEWARLRSLVEWGCGLVRSGPPTDGERAWQLASIAIAQRAADWDLLRDKDARTPRGFVRAKWPRGDHARHAVEQFPGDPEVAFAREQVEAALALPPWPRGGLRPPVLAGNHSFDVLAKSAVEGLQPFLETPPQREEAYLWIGLLQSLSLGRPGDGLAHLAIASQSRDPFIVYLAHYAAGRLAAEAGRPTDAIRHYRAALDALPGAQSASLSLASLLFMAGSADEAYEVMRHSLDAPVILDPFKYYGFGSYRRLHGYLQSLRARLGP